ncbi:MAG: cytochrome c [Chloroflexota bacterium]|nr:cytochrome c [Chloroflexota bacterium]
MRRYALGLALLIVMLFVLAACGGGGEESAPAPTEPPAAQEEASLPAGDSAAGQEQFATACVACHGPGGEGVPNLGKDMTTSEFIAGLSDAELLEFVKKGRPISDPLSTTGVDMPPKGGNPALTDEQLMDIIAFMRSIQK